MNKRLLIIPGILLAFQLLGQAGQDTIKKISLEAVKISAPRSSISRLPQASEGFIWAGKKNEVISLQNTDANIAEKTPRQIFAKVPGVFVYDMDGTGNQMNISTRSLDPHRGWEFNIRKNGIITNTDLYGYPASHFTLPMEAVERIEMVRGTGALQYGQQFGGMLNYIIKQPDTTRSISLESINSLGSYGLLSTYNAIGGKLGKLEYYAYYSKRVSNGYRPGRSDFNGESVMLRYTPVQNLKLTAEFSRSEYLYQLAGPLNDSMFHENPRQSTRSRDYFNPDIYIPSFKLDWNLSEKTRLLWTISAVLGSRSSALFNQPATTPDAISPVTNAFAPRIIDIDNYHSYTSELRFLHSYNMGSKMGGTLAAGLQLLNNDLHRRQQGIGTRGSDYDLTIVGDMWGRDMHYKTKNVAFFAENLFQITKNLSLSPGVRIEMGETKMSGVIGYLPTEEIPNTIEHHFPLFGLNTSYRLGDLQDLYAGWSQAYRPVVFKDIVPNNPLERTDKNLKDARGYNLEVGYRGTHGSLRWDLGVFRMQYNNRLGNQAFQDGSDFFIYHTNIGNSVTHGVELFAEYTFKLSPSVDATVFTSTSWMDAKYEDAKILMGKEDVDISGNQVETVPHWISRNGLTLRYDRFSYSALYSYTSESFADPMNTVVPSSTGAVGLVPAYGLLDMNVTWRILHNVTLRLNLNNVLDKQYFTKRPSFYPGPGVWPSDGRTANISVGIRL